MEIIFFFKSKRCLFIAEINPSYPLVMKVEILIIIAYEKDLEFANTTVWKERVVIQEQHLRHHVEYLDIYIGLLGF